MLGTLRLYTRDPLSVSNQIVLVIVGTPSGTAREEARHKLTWTQASVG